MDSYLGRVLDLLTDTKKPQDQSLRNWTGDEPYQSPLPLSLPGPCFGFIPQPGSVHVVASIPKRISPGLANSWKMTFSRIFTVIQEKGSPLFISQIVIVTEGSSPADPGTAQVALHGPIIHRLFSINAANVFYLPYNIFFSVAYFIVRL